MLLMLGRKQRRRLRFRCRRKAPALRWWQRKLVFLLLLPAPLQLLLILVWTLALGKP